jgi:hypothetical protein
MKRDFVAVALSAFCLLFLALMLAAPAPAQQAISKPVVTPPSNHDVSLPLSEIVAHAPAEAPAPLRTIPLRFPRQPNPVAGQVHDPVVQTETLPLVSTTNGLNIDGIGADGVAPPDTNGSVGGSQYVQIVNTLYAVYDKTTGALLLGPTAIHNIWSGFNGTCASGDGGDPNVIYDKLAGRWLVSQLDSNDTSLCLAISTSSDATGSYFRYEFGFGNNVPDYPKFGVWPDAYYLNTNTFFLGAFFTGANPCAFDRPLMLSGGAANMICFQQGSSVASLLPSDLDGTTAPPAGEPNFFLTFSAPSTLNLFKFHVDFNNPANSTFTGPTAISVASFSEVCGGGTCIPQSGTTQQLDSLGDRLMFRLAYRNFGNHEALVANHSVTAGSSGGVRWYEIRSPNATPTVFQQGTFAPDSDYRWMGSMAMDKAGDIAVGYSASSSNIHPAIRYTGRVPSDPAGTMETEDTIIAGTGSQNGGLSRWGDYSGMSIDSADDCTFYYTTEYLKTDGSFNWSTRIGSFKFNSCGGPPTPDFSISATPPSQTVLRGNSTPYTVTLTPSNGYNGTVNLSVSGLPSGASGTFSPNPVTVTSPNASNSTLTVQTSSTTPAGTYTLTITGTDGNNLSHSTTVTLVVTQSDFSISASPASRSVKRGASTTYTVTLAPANGFSGSVSLSVSGLPSNSAGSFNPNPVTVTSPNSSTSTLTVTTAKKTPPGTVTLTITGTSGALTHSTTVGLTVTNH